jgi:hypothetical protein
MEYTIIQSSDVDEVIMQVNERLADGWSLCGNLCLSISSDDINEPPSRWFAQALTRNS